MLHEINENDVRGEPGGTTVPARILNQEQGRALVLIEGAGTHVNHGDVVTVDTADLSPEDCPACDQPADERCVACGSCACDRHDNCQRPDSTREPAADLPQIAVSCPRCSAPAGALCTSHSGTRVRKHDTHQDRRAAWTATAEEPSR